MKYEISCVPFALKFTIWNKLEPCLIYVWINCEEIHYLGKCIWFDLQIYKTSSLLKCINISLKIPVYKILKYVFVQQSCIHFTVYICVVPHVIFVMCVFDCSPGFLRGRQRRTGSCSTVWTRCSSYWGSVTSLGTQSGPTTWTLSGVSLELWKKFSKADLPVAKT